MRDLIMYINENKIKESAANFVELIKDGVKDTWI